MNRTVLLIVSIIVGLIIGGLLGELISYVLPTGVVKTFFLKSVDFGFEPVKVDLVILSFTFGFKMEFNFISLVSIVIIIYYFKWWL